MSEFHEMMKLLNAKLTTINPKATKTSMIEIVTQLLKRNHATWPSMETSISTRRLMRDTGT